MMPFDHRYFMEYALKEALWAFDEGEVPVGAIIVKDDMIIGRGHNRTEVLKDATAHAEMIALTSAAEKIGDWRLDGCLLYSTIEPCVMCSGAAVLSRIKCIIYGAADPKFGACESIFQIPSDRRLNHCVEIVRGIMEAESAELMQSFFKNVRQRKG
jgi:tRNA(adenine34) deaminase